MLKDPPIVERRPGHSVPGRQRAIATLVVIACCGWLNVRPQFPDHVYRPMEPKYGTGFKSEHGWPLVAFQLFRATHTFDRYGLGHPAPFGLAMESWSKPKLAYNACACFALVLLAAIFYLPWDAYPEPKFSLIELFVFLTSAAVGAAFISSQFATQATFGEIVPLAAIWIVGTGIVNGIFAHLAWRSRRRRAIVPQGTANDHNVPAT